MPFDTAYQESITLAREILAGLDARTMAIRTGGSWEEKDGGGLLSFPFWDGDCIVEFPGLLTRTASGRTLRQPEEIVVLHYLIYAEGVPLQNDWVTFRQIPSGMFYLEPFTKRCIKPFVSFFGSNPLLLSRLNRGPCDVVLPEGLGDYSLVLRPLPYVPVAFVLWKGDDEFPPEGNILFDRTAPHFLPTEDLVVLASLVTYGLLARGRALLQK